MTFSRKRNALIVTALSLLLVFTCICPAFTTKQANADNIPIEQRQVYYFSDNSNLYSSISSKMSEIGIPSANYHNELVREDITTFTEDFIDYASSTTYSNIPQNAYIIFEMRTNLVDYEGLNLTSYLFIQLREMFSSLKNKNCKIMFISGTEECLLYLENDSDHPSHSAAAFLDYVDIHINLDLLYVLSEGISQRLSDAEQLTLYMDTHSDVFLKYLLRILRYKYDLRGVGNLYLNSQSAILNALYVNEQVTIFGKLSNNKYKLLNTDQEYFFNEMIEDPVLNGKVAAIAMPMQYDYPPFSSFVNEMNSLRNSYGETFDFFAYNPTNINLSDLTDLFNVCSVWLEPSNFFTVTLPVMIKKFLNDEQLQQYDNWFGRAAINHKPIAFGSGGWIDMGNIAGAYEEQTPPPWICLWDPALTE